MYFKDIQAALVVYDITDHRTFKKAKTWVEELDEVSNRDNSEFLKYVVGNKSDRSESQ